MFFSDQDRFSSESVMHNSHVVYKGRNVDQSHVGPGSYYDKEIDDKR